MSTNKFKIVGFPPSLGALEIKNFLASAGVACDIQKNPRWTFALMSQVEEMSVEQISKLQYKDCKLSVTPWVDKGRKREPKHIIDYSKPAWERIADKVTPLWRLTYQEQLEKKQTEMEKVMKGFQREMKELGGADLTMLPIEPCPEEGLNGYRNKCEFSIGLDENGEKTVGFMLGLFKDGILTVANAEKCVHVNEESKFIANSVQDYIRQSEMELYDREAKTGFWRLLLVRTSSRSSQVLLMLQCNASGLETEAYNAEKQKFLAYMNEKMNSLSVEWSLYWQNHEGVHNGITEQNIELLQGPGYLTETLNFSNNSFKFHVSPLSFFQSNTPACEKLYERIGEWISDGDKIVLDLCSGTGTIGISLSRFPSVKQVIGIELVQDAVNDAIKNAKLNNLDIQFICDKVENALEKLLKTLPDMEVVAVLDPPRAGVHKNVVTAIRSCKLIKQLIYVSCNPKAAVENWVSFCRPASKRYPLQPFTLVQCQPVDMFPHTEHCELLLKFVRDFSSEDQTKSEDVATAVVP